MKALFFPILMGFLLPLGAVAATEGVPEYYNRSATTSNQPSAVLGPSGAAGAYVGQNSHKQIVGQRTYTYQVPAAQQPIITGTMTPSGIAINPADEPAWVLSADYARKYAKFAFETGVRSRLEWNDMIFNEIGIMARHNFSVRSVDMFAFGEYRLGQMESGGMSIDYDLKPYDDRFPTLGIFTVSIGGMSGKTNHIRLGLGARNIWDVGGWKLSPSIGYEIFNHDLKMSDHLYPNPGIYLPMLNQFGDYIYGDAAGKYYSVPQGVEPPEGLYQVCLSPEDIKVTMANPDRTPQVVVDQFGNFILVTGDYQTLWGDLPWGVGPDQCVIIGGDGPILVEGTTHIYNTRWSGLFIGLEVEKQMTFADKLRFYAQVGLPSYHAEGTWPNRVDWQQYPSFIDEGKNGSFSYQLEMEYIYTMTERLQLVLKADTSYYHVGQIPGKLFVATYTTWLMDEYGQYVLDANGYPIIEIVDAQTEHISDSLRSASWMSFGFHIGVKYAF